MIDNVVMTLWTSLSPALYSMSGYLIGIPLVYGLLSITNFVIGKRVRTKLYKIWEVCIEWTTMLCLICFLIGIVVRIAHMSTLKLPHVGSVYTGDVSRLVAGTLGVTALSVVIMSCSFVWFGIKVRSPILTAGVTESPNSHELDEIWRYLKKELKEVRREIVELNRNEEKSVNTSIFPVREITQRIGNSLLPSPSKSVNTEEDDPMVDTDAIKRCTRCGEQWHRSITCPYARFQCHNCGLRGHKACVCPHIAHTDAKGRVVTRIENRPGSVKMYQRRDRTQGDALDTTGSVVEALHQAVKLRAQKEKERRMSKKVIVDNEPVVIEVKEENEEEEPAIARPAKSSKKERASDLLLLSSSLTELLAADCSDEEC